MKLLITILLCASSCAAQDYSDKIDKGITGILGTLITSAATLARGDKLPPGQVKSEIIGHIQSGIYAQTQENYYDRYREREDQQSEEDDYQRYAAQQDKLKKRGGLSQEEYFHKRYYGW